MNYQVNELCPHTENKSLRTSDRVYSDIVKDIPGIKDGLSSSRPIYVVEVSLVHLEATEESNRLIARGRTTPLWNFLTIPREVGSGSEEHLREF